MNSQQEAGVALPFTHTSDWTMKRDISRDPLQYGSLKLPEASAPRR